ncbi:MAG: TetR family transcriptional regulator [Dermatophilaceae bacterium]|nr:TetR family transcriptional regulator [Dermatophilaceae bacterium]
MTEDRRAAIAAAAIRVVDRDGLRGLTHRAVDREAGYPLGTTSNYAPTRADLVELLVRRMGDLVREDLTARAPLPTTPDATAQLLAGIVEIAASRGTDARVRFALALDLADNDVLHSLLTDRSQARARLLTAAHQVLAALGITDAGRRATDLVGLLDGLLFNRLAGARRGDAPVDVANVLEAYLRGLQAIDRSPVHPD